MIMAATTRHYSIVVNASETGTYTVGITNLGTDGTAYVFINRQSDPMKAYWFWTR
jgi:hypothetical protein